MILMINGSFGVGKTTAAESTVKRLPGSMLYDPELVGDMLDTVTRDIRPEEERTGDFQDIALWPVLVVDVARRLRDRYRLDLIVPMTLDNRDRLAALKQGFESIDAHTVHVCLTAPLEVVLERLRGRGESNGPWTVRRAVECAAVLGGSEFATHIETSGVAPSVVVDRILEIAGSAPG